MSSHFHNSVHSLRRSLLRSFRLRFLLLWRLRAFRAGAALLHWGTPQHNPFLLREFRIARHSKRLVPPVLKPIAPVIGPLLLVLFSAMSAALCWAIWAESVEGPLAEVFEVSPFALRWAYGENALGFAAMVGASVCSLATLLQMFRPSTLLGRERLGGTLDQLRLLPVHEARWMWLMSAPPFFDVLLLYVLCLPLWLLALATNQWTFAEFFGLLFLLLMMTIPAVQPQRLEEDQLAFGGPNLITPTSTAASKRANRIKPSESEEQDKTAATTTATIEGDATENTTTITANTPTLRQQLFSPLRTRPYFRVFDPVYFLIFLLGWQGFGFFAQSCGFSILPRSVFVLALPHWRQWLPDSVFDLAPSVLLSWPLLIARFLTTPLPFFSLALPPFCWILLCWFWHRYSLYASWLLTRRDTIARAEYRRERYRAALRARAMVFWFFGLGYVWPWLINKGALAAILPGAPVTSSWAQAAFWTLLLLGATWAAHNGMTQSFAQAESPTQRWHAAALSAGHALFIGVALYFGFCWLGGSSGIDDVWLLRLLPTLGTVLAIVLLDFAALALHSALPARYAKNWLWAYRACAIGFALEVFARHLFAFITGFGFFDLQSAPHVLLSPLVALLVLLRFELHAAYESWLIGAVSALIVAVPCLLVASALSFDPAWAKWLRKTSERPGLMSLLRILVLRVGRCVLKLLQRVWQIIYAGWKYLAPPVFKIIITCFRWLFWPLRQLYKWLYRHVAVRVEQALAWGESLDNPVLTRSLRRARKNDLAGYIMVIGTILMLLEPLRASVQLSSAGAFLSYSGISQDTLSEAATMLVWRNWGEWMAYVIIAVGCLPPLGFLVGLSSAFDRERASGSMVFLFLTPLSNRAIAGGKIGGALLCGLLLQLPLYPGALLAAIVCGLTGRSDLWPLLLIGLALAHTVLVANIYLSLWCAARARTAGSGCAFALFLGFFPQMLLFIFCGSVAEKGPFALCLVMAVLIPLFLLITRLCWHGTLRLLDQERYAPVALSGTIAN